MLTLDIANLAEPDLRNAIVSHCSEFGTVKVVNVLLPNDKSEYVVAVVTMATPAEAAAVDRKFGNAKVGSTAIIRLEQEVKGDLLRRFIRH
jgi:hypothetical protein